MKLKYLAQVKQILDDYDFQDKYKVMLDLEKYISKLEQDGHVESKLLLQKLGTPSQFADRVISKYKLVKNPTVEKEMNPFGSTDQLLTATHMDLEKQIATAKLDATVELQPIEEVEIDYQKQIEKQMPKEPVVTSGGTDTTGKRLVRLLFAIISISYYIFAVAALAFSTIIAVGLLFFIDIQTAISFILAVILLLISCLFILSFIKRLVYGLIDSDIKKIRSAIKVTAATLCILLSYVMISKSIDTVNIHVEGNLDNIKQMFAGFGINVSEVDWNDLDLGEYIKLVSETLKMFFGSSEGL